MGKKLVIVESPAKAKTINKILGKDFVVKASMGHVRDLPQKKLGIDLDKNFEPEYVNIKGRATVLKELKDVAKSADAIYLAPDPDREGEAIAWHLLEALKKKGTEEKFFRVTYNEITAAAIREAFAEPTRIDSNKVNSQQARRILDRIVGYKVSPLLWRRIRGASSAGRVQSVALRLVCEREREIQNFVPQKYWLLGAIVRKEEDPKDPFQLRLAQIDGDKAEIHTQDLADEVNKDLDNAKLKVVSIKEREMKKKAQPPYITSTLQQAGSRFFGFTPSRTMSIAQKLYEGVDFGDGPTGLITYMRTDSVSIAKGAQEATQAYVKDTYGAEYVPDKPNVYKSRGSAQEAHEAIRPTDVTRTPESLASVVSAEELKVYKVIWQRFVASQMAPARIKQILVEVAIHEEADHKHKYLFRASSSEVVFQGYLKVTSADQEKKGEEDAGSGKETDEVEKLPPLKEGEPLECMEWLSDEKETQPPPRYSEASLVRALEENGVGRPSTYASILSTLDKRKYVEKEKRSLSPTKLGMSVNEFLVGSLEKLFAVDFTARMEEELDSIEEGSVEWHDMLKQFYENFVAWMEEAKGPDADPKMIDQLLTTLNGVKEWGPEVKRGKRTYSDKKFVESVKKQLDDKKKPISQRQLVALLKLGVKYQEQLPDLEAKITELGLADQYKEVNVPIEPPREETIKKLDILAGVNYNEPRKVGKRVYDDKVFCESLRGQCEGGKRLTTNQIHYLDRLFIKYSDQIENYEEQAKQLGINLEEAEDHESGPILALFKDNVKEWNAPVMRGKREWSDEAFFTSLSEQFDRKKMLSVKQRASLKKMAKRYASQIPNYEDAMEKFGLPEPSKSKPKAKKKKS